MRLIDADDVIQRINDIEITPTTNLFDLLGRVIGMIDNAPTIETVKRGHWIDIRIVSVGCGDNAYLSNCSACGAEVVLCDYDNYCPACGADMAGDD